MLSNLEKNINERFLEVCNSLIIEYQLKSKAAFARMIHIHPQILSDYKKFKLKVGVTVLSKVISTFQHINISYILTGKGNMFLERYHVNEDESFWQEDPVKYFQNMTEEDFERIKIEYMISRSRGKAYEVAFSLLGLRFTSNE